MSFKSITTFLHSPKTGRDALEYSIQAARQWGAHLHVVAAGVDSTDPGFYYAGAQAIAVQTNLEFAQSNALEIEKIVRTRLDAEDITWDVETVTLMAGGLESFLADHMRFFDLAILPLPYGKARSHIDITTFEACLFGADIPVIVVPDAATWKAPKSRILIAWDNGSEALAAARASLPIAESVELTDISIIDPSHAGSDRSDPGRRLAQLLARSGANVEINVTAKLRSSVAEQILQRATETDAELIVMGAYGHSRLKEAVLGGVTRSMMRHSTVPVMLAR